MIQRSGYSLIELVAALIAATVLVASLAGTIVITTELLEAPPDDQAAWHDREIADRLAADLRYATDIDESYSYGFQISKPDPDTGTRQTVSYQSYSNGLTRQIDGGAVVSFDPEAPSQQFQVDGYSAPTMTASAKVARLRSSQTASTTGSASNLAIDLPPGCKSGDLLLLCISAKTPSSMYLSESGWQTLSVQSINNLRLVTVYRSYNPAQANTVTIGVNPSSAMSAAIVAVENVDPSTPIDWSRTDSGYAWSFSPGSHPSPLETSGFSPGQLNVQVFAADGDPWLAGTLGIASFTDGARATGGKIVGSICNSVGIAIRSGPTPSLSNTPRLWFQSSGFWLQTGIRLEAAP